MLIGQLPQAMQGGRLIALVVLLVAWVGAGCASYTDHIRDAKRAVVHGQPTAALELLNERLEVDTADDLPADLEDNRTLMLLERATLLQALGEYRLAARDMAIVDQHLEFLDIARSSADEVARFLYSDDAGTYRAPAYERLMLNTLNMVNYLALGELEGARVEARRFHIMERYFLDASERAVMPGLVALGNYLAGATFEASRDYRSAVRFYSRAWVSGFRDADLERRLTDLFRVTGYKARDLEESDALGTLIQTADARGAMRASEYARRHLTGDTLVVVQTGLVPYRQAQRVPVGYGLSLASSSSTLSVEHRHRAHELHASGLLQWINFAELTSDGLPHSTSIALEVGGKSFAPLHTVDVSTQVVDAWTTMAPTLIGAAITRLVTRAVAGGVTRATADAVARKSGAGDAAGLIGILAGMAVEGTMSAVDTPDTRSWTTLPATVQIARLKLDHGLHVMNVKINGRSDRRTVGVDGERLNVVNFSRVR